MTDIHSYKQKDTRVIIPTREIDNIVVADVKPTMYVVYLSWQVKK